jgi:hypothetical protein
MVVNASHTMASHSQEIHILHVDNELDLADLAATFLQREYEQFSLSAASTADEGRIGSGEDLGRGWPSISLF